MAENNRLVGSLATDFTGVDTTANWVRFNPAQGSASTSRVGRVVYLHGIKIKGTLIGAQANSSDDDARSQFRIHIGVWDPDVSTPPLTGVGPQDLVIAGQEPRNGVGKALRRTLYDKTYLLTSPGPDSTGYMPVQRQISIRLRFKKPIKMSWTDEATSYPNKFVYIQMLSDCTLAPCPGFISGYYTWEYKEQ